MYCNNNEDSQCCKGEHKEKIVPCALAFLTIAMTIVGFTIGYLFIGKSCCNNCDQK